jgi:hypothetical protein
MPSRAGTDGRKFSTSTSAFSTILCRTASPFRLLQIERERALAAVGAEEEAALACKARRKLAEHIALRRFDLDHRGAEIREQCAAIGAGEIAAQIKDGDAVERTGRSFCHHCRSRVRIAVIFSKTRCAR